MAKYMLKAKSIPKESWAKVVLCVECQRSKKRKVDNFKVFGNIAYAHVSNQGRSKLDNRSMKHVFIGYDTDSKGYKLYNPNNGKIIISRDVEFDEEAWNWEKEEDTCDFLPCFVKDDQEVIIPNEFSIPLPSPTPSIHEASSSNRSSSKMT
ncbi:hypothetical protein CR513_59714, partial [Mucuna pruriens]